MLITTDTASFPTRPTRRVHPAGDRIADGSAGPRVAPTHRRSVVPAVVGSIVTAVLLGSLAVVADNITGDAAGVLLLVASTGFSWALGAMFWGSRSSDAGAAAVVGLIALVGAVIVYYAVIALWQTRPEGSALAEAGLAWSVIGLVAGPTCGVLGWYARHAAGVLRPVAAGLGGGLLTSQATALLFENPYGINGIDGWVVGGSVTLAVAGIVVVTRFRQLPIALAVALPAAAAGGLMWSWLVSSL